MICEKTQTQLPLEGLVDSVSPLPKPPPAEKTRVSRVSKRRYDAEYFRQYRKKNAARIRERQKAYYATPEGRAKTAEYALKRRSDPAKREATKRRLREWNRRRNNIPPERFRFGRPPSGMNPALAYYYRHRERILNKAKAKSAKAKLLRLEKRAEIRKLPKVCRICKRVLEANEFQIRKRSTLLRRTECVSCMRQLVKTRPSGSTERKREQSKAWRDANREKANKICSNYRARHQERRRKSAREWAKRNRKQQIERSKFRYRTEPIFNLKMKLRRRIGMAIRNGYLGKKLRRFPELLGCSYDFLKTHIESTMPPGMTWDDLFCGRAHLDHIIPISRFNLSTVEEQRRCFGWENLQALWALDNIRKGNKLLPGVPHPNPPSGVVL